MELFSYNYREHGYIYFHLEHSFLKCLSTYSSFVNSTRYTHTEYCCTIWNSSKIIHRKEVKGKTISIEVQSWHSITRCNESVVNVLEMEQSWEQWSRYRNRPRMLTKTIYTVWTTLQIQCLWKSRWLTELAISMKLLFYYFHAETWANT
jgi:hypothetical protein